MTWPLLPILITRFRYIKNCRHALIKKHESKEEEDSPISKIDYSVQGYITQLTRSTVSTSTEQENSESLEFSSTPWDDCSFLTMTGIKSTLAESYQVLTYHVVTYSVIYFFVYLNVHCENK